MKEPRIYQEYAIQAVFDYFTAGNTGNPLVVMPTGTGKSLVIAELIRRIFYNYPNSKVMMITHNQDLISQNAATLLEQWPLAPIGIHSAGLRERDIAEPIIYGGVKSIANSMKKNEKEFSHRDLEYRHFGKRDLIFVDECHLISPNEGTDYAFVLNTLKQINPALKVIGFSATPYRLRMGMLTEEGGIFTHVCYDLSSLDNFNELIRCGYLCTLIPKKVYLPTDISNVKLIAGEYNQKDLETAFGNEKLLIAQCQEIIYENKNRNCCLIFTSSVTNAEKTYTIMSSLGASCVISHSKMSAADNEQAVSSFKAGQYKYMINICKYTTGFDHPPIDCIVLLVATTSTSKYVQMLGRGTRPHQSKVNTLVLCFGGNVARLGCINDPVIPSASGKKTGDAPIKICACGVYNHASARFCVACGEPFPEGKPKTLKHAANDKIIKETKLDTKKIVEYDVQDVTYSKHDKQGAPSSLKCSYRCGATVFHEWICIMHKGFAVQKAYKWWIQRSQTNVLPTTIEAALLESTSFSRPVRIRVDMSEKYPVILSYEF